MLAHSFEDSHPRHPHRATEADGLSVPLAAAAPMYTRRLLQGEEAEVSYLNGRVRKVRPSSLDTQQGFQDIRKEADGRSFDVLCCLVSMLHARCA
jgi:hypothetical protein